MVQYIEHETLVDELVTLETFSPEERLLHARKRRQGQLNSYDVRDKRPDLFPNYHASHNKNIRFEKNIELIEAASRNDAEEDTEPEITTGHRILDDSTNVSLTCGKIQNTAEIVGRIYSNGYV